MTTARALIAEDEPLLAMALTATLKRLWPELTIAAVAENGVTAVQKALELQPDILFLDIKMPGKTGLEVAGELADEWPQAPQGSHAKPFPLVVFVTAYDEYAVAAFEQAAADYVCKPVSDQRLSKTVQRLQERLQGRAAQARTVAYVHQEQAANPPKRMGGTEATAGMKSKGGVGGRDDLSGRGGLSSINDIGAPADADNAGSGELERLLGQLRQLLPSVGVQPALEASPGAWTMPAQRLTMIRAAVGNHVRMVPVEDVVYFEAADKYVTVVTKDSELLIRTSLKELLPQLDPERFWQVHRGTVVNARCIAAAVRDEAGKLSLKLHGRAETLPVSRVFAHLFRQM